MQVHLLFFASMKDRAGVARADLQLPEGARVSDLKESVGLLFPGTLPALKSVVVAVSQQFVEEGDLLADGVEVALFPPVSGGAGAGPTILKVTNDPLDLNELVAQITLPTTGAACVFTGMVRGVTGRGEPHETARLEYEAYVPMAEGKMGQVAEEIRSRWPDVEGIVMVQRIGLLDAGTPTVLVACSASHRDTGVFEAARYGIDRLKEIVPVWKKEIGPDGETWIEGHYHPKRGD